MANLDIITLNCQGLRSSDSRDTLFSWLNCCNVDILCVQETHSVSVSEFSHWLNDANEAGLLKTSYACISSPGANRSCGVAILFKKHIELLSCVTDQEGRLVCAQFTAHHQTFQVCNIYGPNKSVEGAAFFDSLYQVLDSSLPCILCGDFNTVVDPYKDRRGCNPLSRWAYNWSASLSQLMSTFELQDVWRVHHPDVAAFTWHRYNSSQASRLDMFWLSAFFLPFLFSVDILPFFRSDHSYVYLQLSLPQSVRRGRGMWKFNVLHLKDLHFVLLVTQFWESWQAEKRSFSSLCAWWDAGKARLQRLIRSYSRKQASAFRRRVSSLERTLFYLHRRSEGGEDVDALLADTKSELEEAHRHRAKGCRIRANVQWAEEGEASTAYFSNLERRKGENRTFEAIKTLNGLVVSSLLLIMRAWAAFYVRLFTAQPLELQQQDFFLGQLSQRLSDAERSLCEGEVTLEECKAALDGMASGKSPGIDGLPAEFYQRFWPVLGRDLTEVINASYRSGCLSLSQRSGLITLLYKRGDRLEMKNWRPITLLCVDYKIAAKAIANRLLQVLPSIIHTDQSCGVRGRNPVVNNRLMQDIVSDINRRGLGGAILSLDQEKAFDRVDWSFLLRVLLAMNFGSSFRKWILLFYTRISSSVLVNGERSAPFSVSRGVRQGCPLSPLLYVIMAETIASAIRNNSVIDGFSFPGNRRVKLCQYADDTSVFVMSDAALLEVFSLFHRYELASGARLNVTKSHGLLVGSWTSRTRLPVHLNWSSRSITVMGVELSNADDDGKWASSLNQLDSVLSQWQARKLSYHGRALVVNSFGLSIFWYLVSFLDMPGHVQQRINSRIFSFVWQRRRERLARASVTQRTCRGGLNVVDLQRKISAFHCMWVRRLVEDRHHVSTFFFRYYLRAAFAGRTIEQILLLNAPSQTALNILPPFYRSVMASWFRLSRRVENETIFVGHSDASSRSLDTLSVRFVYEQLSRADRREHRCVEKYRSLGLVVDWSTVWSNLNLWRFIRPVRDTNWLIAHGVLYTADRLIRFGMQVDPSCHCGAEESAVHLFTRCPVARRIFAWYQSVVKLVIPSSVRPSPSQLLVGYDRAMTIPPVFPCLLGIIRHRLWIARNGFRLDQTPVVYQSILSAVKSSLRFVVRIQQRHCPRDLFVEAWLANGLLGHVSEENIIVFKEVLL